MPAVWNVIEYVPPGMPPSPVTHLLHQLADVSWLLAQTDWSLVVVWADGP